TIHMFRSLKAGPLFNPIILASCQIQLERAVAFRAFHVPGLQNGVADALSRNRLDLATALAPGLLIQPFTAPSLPLTPPNAA
ncbi:hypothetical protein EXIGLDRAFT_610615, partial [Exidia glandulosa HHB12029]